MKTLKPILTPLIAASVLAGIVAQAAQYNPTVTPGTIPNNPGGVPGANFQQLDFVNLHYIVDDFNTALGTLTGVNVRLIGRMQSSIRNNGTVNETYTSASATATFSLQHPSLNGPGLVSINLSATIAPPPIALNPGQQSAFFTGAVGSNTFAVQTPGAWDNGVDIDLVFNSTSGGQAQGGANFAFISNGQSQVVVTYFYDLPNIPEPKVYGALGAVVCLGLLGYRQYRLKQQA